MNNKIINFINRIFRNDDITKHIARISQKSLENVDIKIEDIKDNIFLDTSTWGINIFEKELDLEYTQDKTVEERKAIISAKWRGAGKLTLELIQDTVKAYTDNVIDIHFDGIIILDFSDKIGVPSDIDSLMKSIEDIKPAHLGINYIFRYRTWGDLKPFTWGNLVKTTWKETRESEKINANNSKKEIE